MTEVQFMWKTLVCSCCIWNGMQMRKYECKRRKRTRPPSVAHNTRAKIGYFPRLRPSRNAKHPVSVSIAHQCSPHVFFLFFHWRSPCLNLPFTWLAITPIKWFILWRQEYKSAPEYKSVKENWLSLSDECYSLSSELASQVFLLLSSRKFDKWCEVGLLFKGVTFCDLITFLCTYLSYTLSG